MKKKSAPRTYRRANGQLVSKERYERQRMFRVKVYALLALGTLCFGVIAHTVNPIHVTQATEEVATTTPIEIEVYEVTDVPDLDPFEVAMYYVEGETKLMQAMLDGDLDHVQDILDEHHAYARAIGIKTYERDINQ